MSERLCRSRRVLAVQLQLDRLAEWGQIDLQFQAAFFADQQCGLIRFMSGESNVTRMFSSTMMCRLQTITDNLATIANEQESQRSRHLDERGKLRRAEMIVRRLEYEVRCKNSLQQLSEAIEAVFQQGVKPPASSLDHYDPRCT